jgi:hypothetical protein
MLYQKEEGRGFSTLVSRHERIYVEEGCKRGDWMRGTPALALANIGSKERDER